jgi:DNA-directed RNA polymerase specialized sigma subunit
MSDNQNLNPDELLISKNFNDIVNVIIYRLGNFDEDIKNDIRQACALAVLKSVEKYDPEKNNKFWVYALKLMKEYARNELNLHKNIIHIPYNRINSAFKNYDNVAYSYSPLTFENGSDLPICVLESDTCTMMDLQNAIDSLESKEQDIVKMRIGLKKTNNGKNDFTSIGDTVGMPMHRARNIYIESAKKLMEYLEDYLDESK